ncbi:MAG: hypothetical protein L0207_04980 [Chlamydiae bacterium]|nr:hypothetical protein [Chlamydiota bacterium]
MATIQDPQSYIYELTSIFEHYDPDNYLLTLDENDRLNMISKTFATSQESFAFDDEKEGVSQRIKLFTTLSSETLKSQSLDLYILFYQGIQKILSNWPRKVIENLETETDQKTVTTLKNLANTRTFILENIASKANSISMLNSYDEYIKYRNEENNV